MSKITFKANQKKFHRALGVRLEGAIDELRICHTSSERHCMVALKEVRQALYTVACNGDAEIEMPELYAVPDTGRDV